MSKNWEMAITEKSERVPSKPESEAPTIEAVPQRPGEAAAATASPAPVALETAAPQIPRRSTKTSGQQLSRPARLNKEEAQMVQEQCRRLCLPIFFCEHARVRSLGFTSSLGGEGKTLLAMVTAGVLADDSNKHVTLLECNWEHPCLHEQFGVAPTPGLAEWLRGESEKAAIQRQIHPNLTVIPAGNGRQDAIRLLQHIRQEGLIDLLALSNELLVVDLPAIASAAYSLLAASLVESLVVVVHAGVTPDAVVAETCTQLQNLPVQGVILNQMESHIPRWLRQVL